MIRKKTEREELTDSKQVVPSSKVPAEVVEFLKQTGQEDVLVSGLTKEKIDSLRDAIRVFRLGPGASIIQTCSDKCPSIKRCPLALVDRAPKGRLCPIELDLFEKYLREYKITIVETMKGFESTKDVENNPIISSMISDLVQLEILQMRSDAIIADAGLIEMVPSIATEFGVEYKPEEHTALRIKERIGNRKDRLLKQLMATPEMHQKIKKYEPDQEEQIRKRKALQRARELAAEYSVQAETRKQSLEP